MENLEHFNKLFAINCNDKTEKKNNGSTELTYLSWCYAWSEVKKLYPNARYEILKFGENKLPYVFDEKTGYMVFTRVEIEDIEHEMWLPVMDSANKAMKDKPYKYTVKKFNAKTKQYELVEKEVQPATMFDINKTIMRCLTKNLAMFGLGLYIYAGEDLPENVDNEEPKNSAKNSANKDVTPYNFAEKEENDVEKINSTKILETQKQQIKDYFNEEKIIEFLKKYGKSKLGYLTYGQANEILAIKDKEQEEKFKEKEEVF